jgi:hypothetical protein
LESAKKTTRTTKTAIQWPSFKEKDKNIFCMAFLRLYPGGNGEFVESRGKLIVKSGVVIKFTKLMGVLQRTGYGAFML